MRIWTFGGSTTKYMWPTWADILINHFSISGHTGENWGEPGASNLFIQNRVMECHAKNNFTSNDLIFICFTPFFRNCWHTDDGWYCPSRLKDDTIIHRVKNKKLTITPEHYIIRDCAAIASIILSLKSLNVNFYFWFDHDLYKPNKELVNSKNFNFDKVLDVYKEIIKPTHPVMNGLIYRNYKFESSFDDKTFQHEVHPTPKEYLDYINANLVHTIPFLKEGIHQDTKHFVDFWEKKIRKSNTINLNSLGWNVLNNNQWS